MNVLAISGSLRKASFNKRLLEAAQAAAPAGMTITIFEGLGEVPLFNEDLEEKTSGAGNATVVRLREAVATADGLLISTPEYNQSIPGVLKNAIDWLSRTNIMEGKPSAILGATPGRWGTRYAQKELRHVLGSALEGNVMPAPAMYVADAEQQVGEDGRFSDPRTRERLNRFLGAFGAWVGKTRLARRTLRAGGT